MNDLSHDTMRTPTGLVLRKPTLPTILIDLGDKQALEKPAKDAVELAQSMVIDSHEMADQAGAEIATWAKRDAEIEAWRTQFTVPIDNAKKSVMDFVRTARTDLATAQATLKGKVSAYLRVERERVERERAEAERVAREQREKAEAEARAADRRAREEHDRAEALARQAQATQDAAERQRLTTESARAARESESHRDDAATSAAIAQVIVAPPVQEVAKVSGLRGQQTVEIEVTDPLALVTWIVANPAFVHLVVPDRAALKALEKSMKEKFNIPGVKVTRELGVGRAARAA